ncbi:MAG: hypothetical protein Q7K43_02245, partial [Candidatus Woesearchaeota archaeon]|nr:hypothetical protein [Candidatus Woesearchaeota archaeon]
MVVRLTLENVVEQKELVKRLLRSQMVMYGGIDKGGKGTAIKSVRILLESLGLKGFDIPTYEKEHHDLPQPEQFLGYDFIITAEPGWSGVGLALRMEVLKHGGESRFDESDPSGVESITLTELMARNRKYSVQSTAMGFALDREVRYKRCNGPARAMGLPVFTERGIESIFYQLVQAHIRGEKISRKWILNLPGNKYALSESQKPGLVQLLHCRPEVILNDRRRPEKVDDHYFETQKFLQELDKSYRDPKVAHFFMSRGISFSSLDTSDLTVEDTTRRSTEILLNYLNQQQND